VKTRRLAPKVQYRAAGCSYWAAQLIGKDRDRVHRHLCDPLGPGPQRALDRWFSEIRSRHAQIGVRACLVRRHTPCVPVKAASAKPRAVRRGRIAREARQHAPQAGKKEILPAQVHLAPKYSKRQPKARLWPGPSCCKSKTSVPRIGVHVGIVALARPIASNCSENRFRRRSEGAGSGLGSRGFAPVSPRRA
jgi:hypothetical protein